MKEAAVVSMGTEISEEDVEHICELCDQVSDRPYSVRLVQALVSVGGRES